MPFEFAPDADTRIITVTGTGASTLDEVLQAARRLVSTMEECPGYRILADNRKLEFQPSVAEVTEIARTLFDNRAMFRRSMAVVVNAGPREALARIFAALGHMAGIRVDVFTDVTDAMAWLGKAQGGTTMMLVA